MDLPSRIQIGGLVTVVGMHGRHVVTGVLFQEAKVSYQVAGIFVDSDEVWPVPRLQTV